MYDECYQWYSAKLDLQLKFPIFLLPGHFIQNYPEKADIACDTCKTNAQHPQEIIAHC